MANVTGVNFGAMGDFLSGSLQPAAAELLDAGEEFKRVVAEVSGAGIQGDSVEGLQKMSLDVDRMTTTANDTLNTVKGQMNSAASNLASVDKAGQNRIMG